MWRLMCPAAYMAAAVLLGPARPFPPIQSRIKVTLTYIFTLIFMLTLFVYSYFAMNKQWIFMAQLFK